MNRNLKDLTPRRQDLNNALPLAALRLREKIINQKCKNNKFKHRTHWSVDNLKKYQQFHPDPAALSEPANVKY